MNRQPRRLVVFRGDESDLFSEHHPRLLRAVAGAVNTSPEIVEDACQIAWAILLRRQPDRGPTLFAWLKTVAIHEAYRLHRADRATDSLERIAGAAVDDGRRSCGARLPVTSEHRIDDQLEARRALRALADLPGRQRLYLAWKAAGFSYAEIQQLAGGVSYSNVNRHLAGGRRRLRDREAA